MMKKNIVVKKERNNVIYLKDRRKGLNKIENKKKIAQNISILKCLSYGTILLLAGEIALDCNIHTHNYQMNSKLLLIVLIMILIPGGICALFLREVKRCLELM